MKSIKTIDMKPINITNKKRVNKTGQKIRI